VVELWLAKIKNAAKQSNDRGLGVWPGLNFLAHNTPRWNWAKLMEGRGLGRGDVGRFVLSTNCRMAPIWYQNVDSLETAGHHEEAVASNRLPVKNNCKRTGEREVSAGLRECNARAKQRSVAEPLDLKTAFENAGFHDPLGSLKILLRTAWRGHSGLALGAVFHYSSASCMYMNWNGLAPGRLLRAMGAHLRKICVDPRSSAAKSLCGCFCRS